MMRTRSRFGRLPGPIALSALLSLGGCSLFAPQPEETPPPPPEPELLAPLATHMFPYDAGFTGVVGQLQVTLAREEDTFADIARRFNLGYEELVRANPDVDPWLPGEGTRIVLPTQFVLPDAKPEGIVVNVAALRLFYFPKPDKDGERVVMTYPIGIGKIGWATPLGRTKVVSKRKDPWWTPPASVRKEHAAEGDPLPARVPPGPDNPLGNRAMNLGWPSYLIHGTNKPAGVGLRASHGCIRMYPEDVVVIFDQVPVGTRVTVVNQPLLHRVQDGQLYVQSYPPFEDHKHDVDARRAALLAEATGVVNGEGAAPAFDAELAAQVIDEARGIAVPVSVAGMSFGQFVAGARLVENTLPAGSNWDGVDEVTASTADAAASAAGSSP
jgi:L,D-transpeptidase ErfK/SrfK